MVTAASLLFLLHASCFYTFLLHTTLCVCDAFVSPRCAFVSHFLNRLFSPSLIRPVSHFLVCSSCINSVSSLVGCQFVCSPVYLPCNFLLNLLVFLLVFDFSLCICLCWFLLRLICYFMNLQPPFV